MYLFDCSSQFGLQEMSPEQRQKIFKKSRRDFDYNNPTRKCSVCYTLSGWHCYTCDGDFCDLHFHDEKHKKLCSL